MDFTQLRQADPSSLDGVIAYWRREATRLAEIEAQATAIAQEMSSGGWHGDAHEAAMSKMDTRRAELATCRAEAAAIAEITAEAQRRIRTAQEALENILSDIDEREGFTVDGSGVVSPTGIDELAALLPVTEFTLWRDAAQVTAAKLTERIADAVDRARIADEAAATAIRRAIAPGPEDPDGP